MARLTDLMTTAELERMEARAWREAVRSIHEARAWHGARDVLEILQVGAESAVEFHAEFHAARIARKGN